MGEKYITTNFTYGDNKWLDDYWKIVNEEWKRPKTHPVSGSVSISSKGILANYEHLKVEKIIYNFKNPDKPATVVFWNDDTKTVVKCDKEDFTKEGGLAQCYLKKILGTRGNIKKLIKNAEIQE